MNLEELKQIAAKRTKGLWKFEPPFNPECEKVEDCEGIELKADQTGVIRTWFSREIDSSMLSIRTEDREFIVTTANVIDELLECHAVLAHAMELEYFSEGGSTSGWAKTALAALDAKLAKIGGEE